MTTQRYGRAAIRIGTFVVGGVPVLLCILLGSCGQDTGRLTGQMFIPPGMRGTAQWGDVWLIQDYERLQADLGERERLLVLALLGKDAEFMRVERDALLQLAAIREKLNVLNRGEIPVQVIMPRQREITALTLMDSVIAGVRVTSRPATAPELATEIEAQKQRLKGSTREIREKMAPSVENLRRQRSDQKRALLAAADATAAQVRIRSAPVGMDGRYVFDKVRSGDYGLYSRYRLLEWFVLTPVCISPGIVVKDIPRLPGAILDSKAIASLDALCAEIARL